MTAWCCSLFEDLQACAGRRGLSVVVGTIAGRDVSLLQGRATDAGSPPLGTEVPATTATETAIAYCPGCGVDLHRRYRGALASLGREDLVL